MSTIDKKAVRVTLDPTNRKYRLMQLVDKSGVPTEVATILRNARTTLNGAPLLSGTLAIFDPENRMSAAPEIFESSYTGYTANPPATPASTFEAISGNTYYVDPIDGNDANAGSLSAPFKTLQRLKSITASNMANATIFLADEDFNIVPNWATYIAQTDFPYNGYDTMRGAQTTPLSIRPYYPRGFKDKKPTIRYYCETEAANWVNESALGSNIWSITYGSASGFDGNGVYAMFGDTFELGVNRAAVSGAMGAKLTSRGQFNIPFNGGDTKLYIYSEGNPVNYYDGVKIGGLFVFRSYYNGFSNTNIQGLRFEYCGAFFSFSGGDTITSATRGLEISHCEFNKSTALVIANGTSYTDPTECEFKLHNCVFTETPTVGVRLQPRPPSSRAGNMIAYEVYRNKVYGANISAAHMGWFYTQAVGGAISRVWGNYGYDCRNGTGGAGVDGAFIYAELSSANTEIIGNVAEFCGTPYQINNAINPKLIGNVAIDCTKLVLFTATSEITTSMPVVIMNNTWLFTGRTDRPAIGQSSTSNAPITGWNLSPSFKWSQLVIVNNALYDMSGYWNTRQAIEWNSTHLASGAVTLVAGNAVSGFAPNAVRTANGQVNMSLNPHVLAVVGGGDKWFADADNGNVALSMSSPLAYMGYRRVANEYFDMGGASFTKNPTIGAIAAV